jgi:hypothetical protein
MKRSIKSLVGGFMFASRLDAILLRNAAVIVAFHRIRDTPESDGLSVGTQMFERLCRFFIARVPRRPAPRHRRSAGARSSSGSSSRHYLRRWLPQSRRIVDVDGRRRVARAPVPSPRASAARERRPSPHDPAAGRCAADRDLRWPGGWRGYYLAGYDRQWAGRIHLGQITLAAAIDLASQGAREFDFLKGADRVKYLWPVRELLPKRPHGSHSTVR